MMKEGTLVVQKKQISALTLNINRYINAWSTSPFLESHFKNTRFNTISYDRQNVIFALPEKSSSSQFLGWSKTQTQIHSNNNQVEFSIGVKNKEE